MSLHSCTLTHSLTHSLTTLHWELTSLTLLTHSQSLTHSLKSHSKKTPCLYLILSTQNVVSAHSLLWMTRDQKWSLTQTCYVVLTHCTLSSLSSTLTTLTHSLTQLTHSLSHPPQIYLLYTVNCSNPLSHPPLHYTWIAPFLHSVFTRWRSHSNTVAIETC